MGTQSPGPLSIWPPDFFEPVVSCRVRENKLQGAVMRSVESIYYERSHYSHASFLFM